MTAISTDQLEKVNITTICRQYPRLKALSQVDLSLGSGVHKLRLERSRMHYGGTRTWFTCECGRRVGVIYAGFNGPGCVNCLKLKYGCQVASRVTRIDRAVRRLRARLEQGDRRPKYMRHKVYEQILREIEELEALYVSSVMPGIGGKKRKNLSSIQEKRQA